MEAGSSKNSVSGKKSSTPSVCEVFHCLFCRYFPELQPCMEVKQTQTVQTSGEQKLFWLWRYRRLHTTNGMVLNQRGEKFNLWASFIKRRDQLVELFLRYHRLVTSVMEESAVVKMVEEKQGLCRIQMDVGRTIMQT